MSRLFFKILLNRALLLFTVKRKLSFQAPGTLAAQTRQALLLGVAYNLYRLIDPVLNSKTYAA